jgi:hypothetical protein
MNQDYGGELFLLLKYTIRTKYAEVLFGNLSILTLQPLEQQRKRQKKTQWVSVLTILDKVN